MEALFAHTYLLLFGKLAVGGLVTLAVPPFAEMERGFYKSTAAVYILCAFFMVFGEGYLWMHPAGQSPVTTAAVLSWAAFTAAFTVYLVTLFIELPILRARSFPVAILLGALALAVTSVGFADGENAATAALFVASGWAGALVVGAGSTGMLLGHWYLIDTGLDLAPLLRMHAFYAWSLKAELVAVAGGLTLMYYIGSDTLTAGYSEAFSSRFIWLVIGRGFCWGLGLMLMELIRRTLAIPQTMAATGLFYIAALTVAVGEIIAHWLLFRSGLPF